MRSYCAAVDFVKRSLLEGNLQFPRYSKIDYSGCRLKGPKNWKQAEKDAKVSDFEKLLKDFNL